MVKKLNTIGINKNFDYLKGEWHVGVPDRESLTVDSANGDPKAIGAVFGQLGYVGGNLKEFVDNLIKISDDKYTEPFELAFSREKLHTLSVMSGSENLVVASSANCVLVITDKKVQHTD